MSNVSQEGGGRLMGLRVEGREALLREALGLGDDAPLLSDDARERAARLEPSEHLDYFNIEWHVVPSAHAAPFDDSYVGRFYPRAPRDFEHERLHAPSYRDAFMAGHRKHQGQLIGVEATPKPRYLP